MSEPTISFKYIVHCGDPRDEILTKSFCFDEMAPASLSLDPGCKYTKEIHDSLAVLSCSLGRRHGYKILASHPWICAICNKPASSLCFNSIFNLCKNPGPGGEETFPSMIDIAVPVCFGAGLCLEKAREIARSAECMHKWAGVPMSRKMINGNLCDNCGKVGAKVCAGCKSTM